jgi:hypothetical protein
MGFYPSEIMQEFAICMVIAPPYTLKMQSLSGFRRDTIVNVNCSPSAYNIHCLSPGLFKFSKSEYSCLPILEEDRLSH